MTRTGFRLDALLVNHRERCDDIVCGCSGSPSKLIGSCLDRIGKIELLEPRPTDESCDNDPDTYPAKYPDGRFVCHCATGEWVGRTGSSRSRVAGMVPRILPCLIQRAGRATAILAQRSSATLGPSERCRAAHPERRWRFAIRCLRHDAHSPLPICSLNSTPSAPRSSYAFGSCSNAGSVVNGSIAFVSRGTVTRSAHCRNVSLPCRSSR